MAGQEIQKEESNYGTAVHLPGVQWTILLPGLRYAGGCIESDNPAQLVIDHHWGLP